MYVELEVKEYKEPPLCPRCKEEQAKRLMKALVDWDGVVEDEDDDMTEVNLV